MHKYKGGLLMCDEWQNTWDWSRDILSEACFIADLKDDGEACTWGVNIPFFEENNYIEIVSIANMELGKARR